MNQDNSNQSGDRDGDQRRQDQAGTGSERQDGTRKQNGNYRKNNFKNRNRNFKGQDQRQEQRKDFRKNDGQRQGQRDQGDNRNHGPRQQHAAVRVEDETAEDIANEIKAIEAEIRLELNELKTYTISFGG